MKTPDKETAHPANAPLKTNDTQDTHSRNAVNILSTKISCFKDATSTIGPRTVTLGQVYHAIKYGGKHTARVESIRRRYRETPGIKAAKRMAVADAKKKLPVIAVAGTFERRANDALLDYSGVICLDLDDLGPKRPDVKVKLTTVACVLAVYASPSGDGLKVDIRCPRDPSKHLASCRAAAKLILDLTGVEVDQACKDLSRACFMSYDPCIYVNENAIEIEPLPEPERPARVSTSVVDLSERQRIAKELVGAIDWQSDVEGLCVCPGRARHTTGDGPKDCKVYLADTPSIYCVHNSCRGILDAINYTLRSRIGKAEYATGGSGSHSGNQNDSSEVYGSARGVVEPALAPTPYVSPPLALLPPELQDYVYAAAGSLNVDVGFILLPLLSAVGSAIGNARSILLKAGFIQPPVIWTGIVGRSGSRKSPALQKACFAVVEHEKQLSRENRDAQTAYEERLCEWESAKRAERGVKPQPPVQLTCLMDDMTLEALADTLQTNPRGVLVKKDELSHWFSSFDQYTNAKGSDVSRWLQLHTAVFFGVDRRSDQRRYRIHDPRVSITGGIQPQVLKRILTPEFFEQGLAARFLLASPQERPDKWTMNIIPESVIQAACELFAELWLLQPDKDEYDSPCPRLLRLDENAGAVFAAFYDECGMASMQYDEREEAAYNKLTAYAARLALAGQLARDPQSSSVTGEIMQAACNLAHWFGNEAVRIYASLSETREQREQRGLMEFVRKRGGEVTIRDVMQAYWPLKNQKEKAEAALSGLVLAGHGKWEQVPHVGAGRPAPRKFKLGPASTSTQFGISPSIAGNCVDVEVRSAVQKTPETAHVRPPFNPCGRDCLTCTDGKAHLCDECERAFNASKTVQPDGNGEPVWIRLYADETESDWQDAYQKALVKPCEICEEPLAAETYVWFHRLDGVAQCRVCRESQWWADGYEITEQGTPVCWDNRHTREQRIAERERNSVQKLEGELWRKMTTPEIQAWLETPDGHAWQKETGWTFDLKANVDRLLRERLTELGISPDVVDTLDHRRNEHPEPNYVEV